MKVRMTEKRLRTLICEELMVEVRLNEISDIENNVLNILKSKPGEWFSDYEIEQKLGVEFSPDIAAHVGELLRSAGTVEVDDSEIKNGVVYLRSYLSQHVVAAQPETDIVGT